MQRLCARLRPSNLRSLSPFPLKQLPRPSPPPPVALLDHRCMRSCFSLHSWKVEEALPGEFLRWTTLGSYRGSRFATGFAPLQPKPLDSIIDLERARACSPEDLVSVWDDVVIPLSLQRRVEGLIQEHLDRIELALGGGSDNSANKGIEYLNLDENQEPVVDASVMEKILQRKSWRMRNLQRAWQESPEGVKMLNFRRSLPAYKEEMLLSAIARNQVLLWS